MLKAVGPQMTQHCCSWSPPAIAQLMQTEGTSVPPWRQTGGGWAPTLTPTVLGLDAVLTAAVSVFEGAVELRLADGGGHCAGRVEVKRQGQWGTVCDDNWGMEDAAVVCKQLGCGSAVGVDQDGYFGPGSGPIWIDGVDCNGTESALSDCTLGGLGNYSCDHIYDTAVMCSGKGSACSLLWGWDGGRDLAVPLESNKHKPERVPLMLVELLSCIVIAHVPSPWGKPRGCLPQGELTLPQCLSSAPVSWAAPESSILALGCPLISTSPHPFFQF